MNLFGPLPKYWMKIKGNFFLPNLTHCNSDINKDVVFGHQVSYLGPHIHIKKTKTKDNQKNPSFHICNFISNVFISWINLPYCTLEFWFRSMLTHFHQTPMFGDPLRPLYSQWDTELRKHLSYITTKTQKAWMNNKCILDHFPNLRENWATPNK